MDNPMNGTPDEQTAYLGKVKEIARQEMQRIRDSRMADAKTTVGQGACVTLGVTGQPSGQMQAVDA